MANSNYTVFSVQNGLGTFNYTLPFTGDYNIGGTLTLPLGGDGSSGSQVIVTVKVNTSTTLFTGNIGNKGFEVGYSATAGDIINIVLTSSAAPDQQINAIKTSITLSQTA